MERANMGETSVSVVRNKLELLLKSADQTAPSISLRHLKSVDKKLRTIHQFLQAAAGESKDSVRNLSDEEKKDLVGKIRKIRHVAYGAEDTIDRVAAQAAKQRFRSQLRNFLFRCNHVPAIADVRKKVTFIYKQINAHDRHSMPREPSRDEGADGALLSFRKDAEKSEMGFAEEEKKLERKLLEASASGPDPEVVSLVGMGGLGKTSLAKRILDRKQVQEHFKYRAWVHVSKDYVIKDLFKAMVEKCKVPITANRLQEENELRKALSDWLQQEGNRYLIVLDDVWDLEVWDQIKAFPGNGTGSRILIITRNTRVASGACQNPSHKLKPMSMLSDDESWELFMDKIRSANMDNEMQKTLELHKEKILRKCDGLPLAIVSLAKEIVSPTETSHDQPLESYLEDDAVSWLSRTEVNSLAMSYNELPFHLRICFLYIGLFPRNFDIPVRRLYKLWLAEGFAEQNTETNSPKSPEDLVVEYLQDLVDRNLIQMSKFKYDDSPKTCRMPGVLRDIFMPKAQEIGEFYIHGNSKSNDVASQLPVRRVVELKDITKFLHSNDDIQHVRSYISFKTMKNDTPAVDTGSFVTEVIRVKKFGILRVLDLEHVYKPKLPEELGKLYYLRYLGLRWTFLDSLPSSVGDLSNLETLDIKHTYINTLPNSIWKIKKLRHLLLNEIRLDMSLSRKIMSPPTQLQTLWGLYVDKKSPVKNGLDRLINLRKLGLTCHPDSIQEVSQWIAKLSSLETLKLRCKKELDQPPVLSLDPFSGLDNLTQLYLVGKLQKLPASNEFPPKLRVLTLSLSELMEDPMSVLSELPNLNILNLYARSYLGETMGCPKDGFSSLRRLRLWMLDELKTWTIQEGAMQNLQKGEIRCCANLKKLPDRLLKICALEKFIFTNMEALAKDLQARKQEDESITVEVKGRELKFFERPKF